MQVEEFRKKRREEKSQIYVFHIFKFTWRRQLERALFESKVCSRVEAGAEVKA